MHQLRGVRATRSRRERDLALESRRSTGPTRSEDAMRLPIAAAALLALLIPCASIANEEILKLSQDDNQWVTPSKNYSSTRYSTLNQITTQNVGHLREAWSFSTG